MKVLAAIGLASVIALATTSPAEARQGCGPEFHRLPNGRCVPNHGPRGQWIEGRYYAGHGYWAHNRWYQHRQRRNGAWIYL